MRAHTLHFDRTNNGSKRKMDAIFTEVKLDANVLPIIVKLRESKRLTFSLGNENMKIAGTNRKPPKHKTLKHKQWTGRT